MIKHLTIALAFGGLLAGSALAQTTSTPVPAPAPSAPAQAPPAEKAPPAAATAPAQAVTAKVAATPDECLQSAADLVLNAEEKKLADDKIDRIEELLLKMEAHCEGRRFPEALAVATDIKSLIEKQ